MPKIDFKSIFERRNRGIMLDLVVFVVNLILFETLRRLATSLVGIAETDKSAQIAICLFLIGLFFLQPLIPILKRWSFHRQCAFDTDNPQYKTAQVMLAFYKLFYFAMLVGVSWAALFLLIAVTGFFSGEIAGGMMLLAAIALSLAITKTVFDYFRVPKKEPRWRFLTTPQAELLGDICLFLNVICFQILWCVYTGSQQFWEQFYSTTHLKSGNSFNAMMERLWIFAIIALLVYFPPRIFYLVMDQHRITTWLMMLLANSPLIFGIVFFTPATLDTPRMEINVSSSPKREISNNPSHTITAEDFYSEYKLDTKAALKKYAGKYINVTGRISEKGMNYGSALGPVVLLNGGGNAQWVECHFNANQRGAVKMLEENQKVTLQGIGDNYFFGSPRLTDCVIVRAQ